MNDVTLDDVVAYIQVGGQRRYLSAAWPFDPETMSELDVIGEAVAGDKWDSDARKLYLAGAIGSLVCGALTTQYVADFLTEIGVEGDVEADIHVRIGDFVVFRKNGYGFRFVDGVTDYHPAGLIDLSRMSEEDIEDLRERAETGNLDEETREKLDEVYPEHVALQGCMDRLGVRGIQDVTTMTFETIQAIMSQVMELKRRQRGL